MTDVAEPTVADRMGPTSPDAPSRGVETDLALLADGDVQAENYGVGEDQRFRVVSDWQPAGAQPAAIEALSAGVGDGQRFQTLLGITGSGKSATIAWTIEKTQRPTLILAPNKSLAAQLAQEMREFFPDNRVEYFVSYYDYYQPEAYIPSSDTFIEKDSSVNDEIDRLRHSTTAALLTRRDTIVVASVSCIYGMGNPEEYRGHLLDMNVGVDYDMRSILRRLVDMQYDRNDMTLGRGNFRVRGDTIEVHPAYEENVLRVEMFGDTIERITTIDPVTGENLRDLDRAYVFPATHYATSAERLQTAMGKIEHELQVRLKEFEEHDKLLEAQRLRMRTVVRPRDDERGRLLQRHRELLDAHGRSRVRRTSVHPARLLPRRLPARDRREPRRGARNCTGSSPATAAARTCWSTTGSVSRRRATTGRSRSKRCSNGSTRASSCRPRRRSTRPARVDQPGRAGHPADRPRRPRGDREAHQGPDRRSDGTRQRSHRHGRPVHSSPRSRRRWPRTSPTTCSSRACGFGTCTRTSTRSSASRSFERCASASSTCWWASTCCERASTSRGVVGVHPGRRQGGLPALGDLADPDDRAGRTKRRRPGRDVRRQDHPVDEQQRSTPPRSAASCRSPTTKNTASTPRPSARRSATSCRCCAVRRIVLRCRARIAVARKSATRSRPS